VRWKKGDEITVKFFNNGQISKDYTNSTPHQRNSASMFYKEIVPWDLEAICPVGKLCSVKTPTTVPPERIRKNRAGKLPVN
jgi:hypothetical protein